MGTCINVFGIPVLEDRECADARRKEKAKRQKQRQDKRVAVVDSKQAGRTDRTEARVAPGAETPIEGVFGTVGTTLGGIVQSGNDLAASLFGGGGGGDGASLLPILLIGGVGVGAVVAVSRRPKKKGG